MAHDLSRRGRVWRFSDLVHVDEICETKYLSQGVDAWAAHLFDTIRPDFVASVGPGDLIVAGDGFGYGPGHDHPILGLMHKGVAGIVATSFGTQFLRAAVAHGCLVLEADLHDSAEDGSTIDVDFATGRVLAEDGQTLAEGRPLAGTPLDILAAGGLVQYLQVRKPRQTNASV